MDLDEGWVERAGVRDPLGPRELAVLKTLAARPDERVSREELVAAVWGVEPVGARACDRVVYRLRAKLEADPNTPEFLLTEHGAGYRLRLRAPAPSTAPLAARSTGVAVHDRVLDLDRARIDGPDGPVSLTGNEQAVLRLLLDADGRAIDRETLSRAVWGGAAGRALENLVSRLRRKLEPDPGRPTALVTTAAGYRLERGAPAAGGSVPHDVDRQVGRAAEIARVTALAEGGHRWTVLVGTGGVGKTRVASAVARRWSRGPAWFVDLSDQVDAPRMCAAVARTLQLRLTDGDPAGQIGRALAARGAALVVFDNLEQLDPTAREVLGAWLAAAPELVAVGTSRVPLRLDGELAIGIEPLPTEDAAALFVDRAARALSSDERAAVPALVEALEGLPLAIELAAARTVVLSVAELTRRIHSAKDHLRVLSGGASDRPERSRSLRASLDASWELTSDPGRAALARLAVFEGGFERAAALRVADCAPEVLQELLDASWLRRAEPARLGMLRTVRDYVTLHLEPAERDGAERRHVLAMADRWGGGVADGPDEVRERRALGADLDNVCAACARACALGWGGPAARTLAGAWAGLELTGPFSVALSLADQVAAVVSDPESQALAGWIAGRVRADSGDPDRALTDLAGAAGLARERSLPGLEASARLEVARIHLDHGRIRDATAASARAEALLPQIDPATRCRVLEVLAAVRLDAWARDEALGYAEQAVDLATGLCAPRLTATARARLGAALERLDTLDRAGAEFDRALAGAREVGDVRLEAQVLVQRGELERMRGRLDDAGGSIGHAVALYRKTGDRRGETQAAIHFGGVLLLRDALEDALTWMERAHAHAVELRSPTLVARAANALANVNHSLGRYERAELAYRDAIRTARELADPRIGGTALQNFAQLQRMRGDLEGSGRLFQSALALHRDAGNRRAMAQVLSMIADLASEEGRLDDAVATYEAANRTHREVGNARGDATTLHNLGRVLVLKYQLYRAHDHLQRSLRMFRALGDPVWQAKVHLTLAEVALTRGAFTEARAEIEAAERLADARAVGHRMVDLRECAFDLLCPPPRPD